MAWTQRTIESWAKPRDKIQLRTENNLAVKIYNSGTVTYLCYINRGYVPLGRHPQLTLKQARLKKDLMYSDKYMGKLVESSSTFRKFVESEQFQDFSKGRDTHKARMDSMKATILPILGKVKLSQFNKADITRYKNRRKAQGVKDTTINRELSDISGVLTVAKDLELIRDKIKVEKYQEDKGKDKRILEDKEVKALRKSARSTKGLNKRMIQQRKHIALCIDIALFCGLRRGEILQLKWGDIVNKGHFKQMWEDKGGWNLVIKDGELQETDMEGFKDALYSDFAFQVRGTTTKTKQTRLVPISKLLLEELKQYYIEDIVSNEEDFKKWSEKFTSETSGKMDKLLSGDITKEDFDVAFDVLGIHPDHEDRQIFPYEDISNAFITTRKNAGIDKEITFHSLRHNFCTRALESGMDLKDVKELAGHASIVTTERYLHSNPKRKFEEYQKFEKLMMKGIGQGY